MFIFSKKQFVKLIKAPLRVESTDKKIRFRGLSEQKLRELFEDKEEWGKMTKLILGRHKMAVITYLTGIFRSFLPISDKCCKISLNISLSMSLMTSRGKVNLSR